MKLKKINILWSIICWHFFLFEKKSRCVYMLWKKCKMNNIRPIDIGIKDKEIFSLIWLVEISTDEMTEKCMNRSLESMLKVELIVARLNWPSVLVLSTINVYFLREEKRFMFCFFNWANSKVRIHFKLLFSLDEQQKQIFFIVCY